MSRVSITCVLALSLLACDSKSDTETKADAKHEPEPEPVAAEPEPVAAEPEPESAPPGVKTKGNLPVRTESELAAESELRDTCVQDCVQSRMAEAKGAEAIDAECQQQCAQTAPVEQVEVVPDSPI